MIGAHGIPGPVAARWRAVPVDLPLAVCSVARSGQPKWLTREADHLDGAPEPLGLGLPDDWASAAVLPLLVDGGCRGVLALVWTDPHPLGVAARAELERVAAGVATAARRLPPEPDAAGQGGGPLDPVLAVLDVLFHPVVICDPVPQADGRLVDLLVRHANPAAIEAVGRGPEQLLRRRFLELWPASVRSGLFAACARVLQTGAPADLREQDWWPSRPQRPPGGVADVRVTRYRGGVLITWTGPRAPESPADGSGRQP
jgi:PAS domain-containing protein